MRKILLFTASVFLAVGSFLASCAMQPDTATKAPAAATHKDGSGKSALRAGMAPRAMPQRPGSFSR